MNKEDGLDALTKPREHKAEGKEPPKKPEPHKPAAKAPHGTKLRGIMTKQLHDGTFHHTHHYEDARGIPHPMEHEASSANAQDAGQYVTDQFGGGAPSGGDPGAAAAQPQAQSPVQDAQPMAGAQ
jgi:hypothetical protein